MTQILSFWIGYRVDQYCRSHWNTQFVFDYEFLVKIVPSVDHLRFASLLLPLPHIDDRGLVQHMKTICPFCTLSGLVESECLLFYLALLLLVTSRSWWSIFSCWVACFLILSLTTSLFLLITFWKWTVQIRRRKVSFHYLPFEKSLKDCFSCANATFLTSSAMFNHSVQ